MYMAIRRLILKVPSLANPIYLPTQLHAHGNEIIKRNILLNSSENHLAYKAFRLNVHKILSLAVKMLNIMHGDIQSFVHANCPLILPITTFIQCVAFLPDCYYIINLQISILIQSFIIAFRL